MELNTLKSRVLAASFALVLCLLPLARGGWDAWAQTTAEIIIIAGAALWAALSVWRGGVPDLLRGNRLLALFCVAAWISYLASPIALPPATLKMWIFGACIASLAGFIKAEDEKIIDRAIISAVWFMAALAAYQKFALREIHVTSSFFNENVFAGFLTMVIVWLAARGSYVQAAVLCLPLAWTQSRGAELALVVLGAAWLSLKKKPLYRLSAAALVILAGIALSRAGLASVMERLEWWKTALAMAVEKPFLGFGPGSFGFVFPAFHKPQVVKFASIYAHNFPLELAAEAGMACAFLFMAWTAARLGHIRRDARWATLAGLLVALQDYHLGIPANFFFFCYLLSGGRNHAAQLQLDGRFSKIATTALIAVAALGFTGLTSREWREQKNVAKIKSAFEQSGNPEYIAALETLASRLPRNPDLPLLAARMRRSVSPIQQENLLSAAKDYERVIALNPFHLAAYDELAAVYGQIGALGLQAETIKNKKLICKYRVPSAR